MAASRIVRWSIPLVLAAVFAVAAAGCDQLFAYRGGDPTNLDQGPRDGDVGADDGDATRDGDLGDGPSDGDISVGDITRDGDISVGDITRDGDISVGDITRDGDIGASDTTRDGDIGASDTTRDATDDGILDGLVDVATPSDSAVDSTVDATPPDSAPPLSCPPSPRNFTSLTTWEAIALALDSLGQPQVFWAQSGGPLRHSRGVGASWSVATTGGAATNGTQAVAAARDATHVHALFASSTTGGVMTLTPATYAQSTAILFVRAPANAVHVALADGPTYAGGAVLFVQGSTTTVTYVNRSNTIVPVQCNVGVVAKLELPSAVVALNGWIGLSYYSGSLNSVRLVEPTNMCVTQRGPATSAAPGQGFIVMARRGPSIEAMHVAGSNVGVQRQVLPQDATFPTKLSFGGAGLASASAAKRDGIALTTDDLGRVVALHSDGTQLRVATMATTGSWTVNPGPVVATTTAGTAVRLLVKAADSLVHALVVDRATNSATYYCTSY